MQQQPAAAGSGRAPRTRRDANAAIDTLLNQHIVRLRVSAGGQLLSDVGGPYVLAPGHARRCACGGHTIGSFVLSIQDDEGYLRLTRRLAGLDVLMYMNLGRTRSSSRTASARTAPATCPPAAPTSYRGHSLPRVHRRTPRRSRRGR